MNEGSKPRPADDSIYKSVNDLTNPARKAQALDDLRKQREQVEDLPRILWYSVGTIAALLQEIVSIYPLLSPPALETDGPSRASNALALLQCVASDPETRMLFINGECSLLLPEYQAHSSR